MTQPKPPSVINILHLSDLHFGYDPHQTASAQRENALDALIAELVKLDPAWQPNILVISGDLSWQGKSEGYQELTAWLRNKLYKKTALDPKTTVICPGNHDLSRKIAKSLQGHTSDPERADELLSPEALEDGFARPFQDFVRFAEGLEIPPPLLHGTPNFLAGIREFQGLKFLCLNSAWFCRGDQDKGKLWLGQPQLDVMAENLLKPEDYDAAPISIALVHHPQDWFADSESNAYANRPATYEFLAGRAHLILSGHTHGAIVRPTRCYDRARLFRAGATYETNHHYRNNFSILQIDQQARTVTHRPWELDPRQPAWEPKSQQIYSLNTEGPPRKRKDHSRYFTWLRDQTRYLNLHQLQIGPEKIPPPSIDALYIRLKCHSAARHAPTARPELRAEPIELQEALRQHQRLVIEGKPGGGKTTFLRWIAWCLCRPAGRPSDFPLEGFPLFIRISQLDEHIHHTLQAPKPNDPTIYEHLRWIPHFLASQGWGLDESFFTEKLEEPDTALLLDGLDEAANQTRREKIVNMFELAAARFRCRILVTTRPGAHEGRATLTTFDTATMEELDEKGMAGFLSQWCLWLKQGDEPAAGDYLKELLPAVQVSTIRPLARNPLMLTALAALHLRRHRLPQQRAQLYEQIMDWLADQAVEKHPDKWRKDFLLEQFGKLALAMQQWKGGQKLQLGIKTAAQLLTPPKKPVAPMLDFLEQAQVDSGIVTLRSGKELAFWHRSFQEYLAARVLANLPDAKLGPSAAKFLYTPEGREVLPLMAGCMVSAARERLDLLFQSLIRDANAQQTLERKAHAVGVLGNMLADLMPNEYELDAGAAAAYADLREPVMAVFQKGKSRGLGLKTRVAAAEALDQASQSRLRQPGHPDYWVQIPAGSFTIGEGVAYDSLPMKTVKLKAFQIARFPVTVWEYAAYLDDTETAIPQPAKPEDWDGQSQHPSRPVTRVSWHDAQAYCVWASRKWGIACHVPSDEQWEFAARGTEGRIYPWGADQPDEHRANFDSKVGAPSPVGMFPDGDTPKEDAPAGVSDMAGNVWEWTRSDFDEKYKSVRGAGFFNVALGLRAAGRYRSGPDDRFGSLGFRCVRE